MGFILMIGAVIAAFFVGSQIGQGVGRKEVLADLRRRIADGIQADSDLSRELGVRCASIVIDYFAESQHGIGYVEGPAGPFIVTTYDDLAAKKKRR